MIRILPDNLHTARGGVLADYIRLIFRRVLLVFG
jgi:hypothetical protein